MSKGIGELVLDSNPVIAYLAGDERAIPWLEFASGLYLPVICVGELTYGALHSGNPKKNLAKLEIFMEQCTVLDVTHQTGTTYGMIRQALAREGKPIPEADLWIAAICQSCGFLPLLSEDAHFDVVPNLSRYDWTKSVPKKFPRQKKRNTPGSLN